MDLTNRTLYQESNHRLTSRASFGARFWAFLEESAVRLCGECDHGGLPGLKPPAAFGACADRYELGAERASMGA
jgi:hypothetical protein